MPTRWLAILRIPDSGYCIVMRRLPRLRVFEEAGHLGSRRFLVTEQGKPFFYQGDTAWELFHRLNLEEAELYLRDRARKGYTVIQAVVLAELDGLRTPNPYGHLPLHDEDPTKPNEAYLQHVDAIVNRAEALGMYIGMLPTWGDKFNRKWGVGPEIFTPENARIYGEYLGRRYKDKPIIWILGGDRAVENDTHKAIVRAMAEGLRAGDGGAHLITYHAWGGLQASQILHAEPWLDFNMLQSGHSKQYEHNDDWITENLNLQPPKPCMDGEPNYENHPINFNPENGWFGEFDVRRACYLALFAGAHGHTYGCHEIWQMYEPSKHEPITQARISWRQALKLPGSSQIQYAKRLVLSRPMLERVPDQTLIRSDVGKGAMRMRACRSAEGSYAFVYVPPMGRVFTIATGKLGGRRIRGWWYNPRNGRVQEIGSWARAEERTFRSPDPQQDWVLVLDEEARRFPPPGRLR